MQQNTHTYKRSTFNQKVEETQIFSLVKLLFKEHVQMTLKSMKLGVTRFFHTVPTEIGSLNQKQINKTNKQKCMCGKCTSLAKFLNDCLCILSSVVLVSLTIKLMILACLLLHLSTVEQ